MINYPGKEVEDTTPLYDDDIVVDSFIRFLSSANEKDVQAEIGDVIQKKKSLKWTSLMFHQLIMSSSWFPTRK